MRFEKCRFASDAVHKAALTIDPAISELKSIPDPGIFFLIEPVLPLTKQGAHGNTYDRLGRIRTGRT